MLEPVTNFNGRFREILTEQYIKRLQQDKFFYNEEENYFNKQAITNYAGVAFSNLDAVIDLTIGPKLNDDLQKEPWINKLSNFTMLNEHEADFYLKFKPHNGMMSLRRGFYKLLPTPGEIPIQGIESWQTDVLYIDRQSSDTIYKYKCNVGPLVNSFAVVGNLRLNTFYNRKESINKKDTLTNILNKVIYVSSAELVINSDFKTNSKEVLWFLW